MGCYKGTTMIPAVFARPLIYSSENLGIVVPSGFQADGSYLPHEEFMDRAIEEAKSAILLGQHPVGALVTTSELIEDLGDFKRVDGRTEFGFVELEFGLSFGSNMTDLRTLGHAEIIALERAEEYVKGRDILSQTKSVLYTTHEPCPMCAGAIANSKLAGVVYGTNVQDAMALANEGVRWRNNEVSGPDVIRGVQQTGRASKFIIEGFMRDKCLEVLQLARNLGD